MAVIVADLKVRPVAKIDPSSTNMLRFRCFHEASVSLSNGEVKIAEMIGDRGEPCGVPWSTEKGLEVKLLKER
jgi:hypothetical protein